MLVALGPSNDESSDRFDSFSDFINSNLDMTVLADEGDSIADLAPDETHMDSFYEDNMIPAWVVYIGAFKNLEDLSEVLLGSRERIFHYAQTEALNGYVHVRDGSYCSTKYFLSHSKNKDLLRQYKQLKKGMRGES